MYGVEVKGSHLGFQVMLSFKALDLACQQWLLGVRACNPSFELWAELGGARCW